LYASALPAQNFVKSTDHLGQHAGSPAGITSARSGAQAMWVWGRPDPATLINFAQTHGITELFVEVSPTYVIDGDLPRLQQLRQFADSVGIRLDALNGDPSWATNYSAALSWERAVTDSGLFAGLHVDVEPYQLPTWQSQQSSIASAYLGLLQQMKRASALPLEADVPFWYGTIPAAGYASLADAVPLTVDHVSVMSYRDTSIGPGSIADVGSDMVTRGINDGKPVRLAVETNALPDCSYCTFNGGSASQMQADMTSVDATFANSSSFEGIAVEDFNGWLALSP
jgi:hypothetical protein